MNTQLQPVNFHGIERAGLRTESRSDWGGDWTRPDFEWRANWHRSEYQHLLREERRHAVAALLGALTAVVCAAGLVYLFC